MDVLTAEFSQIKALLMNLRTGEELVSSVEAPTLESPISEEDVMSMTASHTQFYDEEEREVISEIQSQVYYDESQDTGRGSAEGPQPEQEVVKRALRAALARLGLDTTSTSAFFRGSGSTISSYHSTIKRLY